MAVKAFVFIETTVGQSREVVDGLAALQRKEKGIRSVDAVTGPYDIVAVIEGPNVNAIGDTVTKDIQAVSGVARTTTCLAMTLS